MLAFVKKALKRLWEFPIEFFYNRFELENGNTLYRPSASKSVATLLWAAFFICLEQRVRHANLSISDLLLSTLLGSAVAMTAVYKFTRIKEVATENPDEIKVTAPTVQAQPTIGRV